MGVLLARPRPEPRRGADVLPNVNPYRDLGLGEPDDEIAFAAWRRRERTRQCLVALGVIGLCLLGFFAQMSVLQRHHKVLMRPPAPHESLEHAAASDPDQAAYWPGGIS
jgi:hypothetical protein